MRGRWISLLATSGALLAGAALASLRTAPASPLEIHFAPAENLERVDARLIDSATRSIDMAAYVLTDRVVIAALERAGERGVRIRIWRDPEMAERVRFADVAATIAPDDPEIAMREKRPGPLMHLKAYCVDGETLRTGSANFSHSGLTEQDNDLAILRSRPACAAFEAKFTAAWKGAD